MIIPHEIGHAIQCQSERFKLPADIVFGVCLTESALNPLAARYEAHYQWIFNPKEVRPRGCSLETEIALQKTSFGLMQVMGGVYRELGFTGWLTAIIGDIQAQIEYGCKHLHNKVEKYGLESGVLAYNSGSPIKNTKGKFINQHYLDRVLEARKHWR